MGALVAPKSMALTCRVEEPSTASQPGTASRQMNSFDAVLDALREILAARVWPGGADTGEENHERKNVGTTSTRANKG
jgi:hypothetical protein